MINVFGRGRYSPTEPAKIIRFRPGNMERNNSRLDLGKILPVGPVPPAECRKNRRLCRMWLRERIPLGAK